MPAFAFDADAYLTTLAPPTITIGGATVEGRHLSAAQWLKALDLLDRAHAAGSGVAYAEVGRFVFDAMYPPPPAPPRRWFRRSPPRPPSVWEQLIAGPPAVWQRALALFFASPILTPRTATEATGSSADSSPSASSGTSSPPTAGAPGTPPASGPPETA